MPDVGTHIARCQFASNRCARILFGATMLWLVSSSYDSRVLSAQDMPPQADPQDLGIRLGSGPVTLGEDRRVVVADELDEPVVARLYLETSNRRVVILPSGRMIAVDRDDATDTDRPYEAIDKEDYEQRLVSGKFAGFQARATRRYLFVYNTSDVFAETTSRILETMYRPLYEYCRRQGIEVSDPEYPLVVIMFRTEEEFQKYRSMPTGVLAYYNSLSNYVVMYEQSRLAEAAPMLATKQAISTAAHEGVHQILHNIGVQQRLSVWPAWISEGLPEFFAPTSIDRRIRWKGVGLVNDLRMHSLVEYLRSDNGSLANGELIRQTISARRLDGNGYAASWALTYYLAQRQRRDFFAYLREVAEAQPLQGLAEDSEKLFVKHFGDDLAGLQEKMLAHLRTVEYVNPIENQPHFVAFCKTGSQVSVIVSTSPSAIAQWQQQRLAALNPAQRAATQLVTQVYGNRALAQQAAQAGLR